MTVSHGLSLGLFIVAAIIVGTFFLTFFLHNALAIRSYLRGEIRFTDMSVVAQWFVLTFLNGGGDGFA